MGKRINVRAKGRRGELEACKLLDAAFGKCEEAQFVPTPQSGAWGGGQNRGRRVDMSWEQKVTLVADIMTPPDFPYIIEHKYYGEFTFWELFNESSNLNSWLDQVVGDAEFVGKKPLLIIKINRHKRFCFVQDNLKDANRVLTYYREGRAWHCYRFSDFLESDIY